MDCHNRVMLLAITQNFCTLMKLIYPVEYIGIGNLLGGGGGGGGAGTIISNKLIIVISILLSLN